MNIRAVLLALLAFPVLAQAAEQAKLTASDAAANDSFGFSVSVSGDTAVVGAWGDDDNGSYSGSAYVFVRTGSTWTEQAKLTASDAAADDRFGVSVSVSGATAVVGANNDDDSGSASGSAYVFVRTGSTWTEQQKLTASDAAANDRFGTEILPYPDFAAAYKMPLRGQKPAAPYACG